MIQHAAHVGKLMSLVAEDFSSFSFFYWNGFPSVVAAVAAAAGNVVVSFKMIRMAHKTEA